MNVAKGTLACGQQRTYLQLLSVKNQYFFCHPANTAHLGVRIHKTQQLHHYKRRCVSLRGHGCKYVM